MKPWKKYLLIAAGVLAGLLVAAVITLKILFPPEKIKAMALEKLETALEREVRIADASINLRGVSLDGLEISELPDFKAGTMVKAESLRVTMRLKPLIFERDVQIIKLSLAGFNVNLTKDKKGRLNLTAKAPKKAPEPKKEDKPAPARKDAKAQGSEPLKLEIAALELADGTVVYDDKAGGTYIELKGLEAEAENVRLDTPFAAKLGLVYVYGKGKDALGGRIDFKGMIDPAGRSAAKFKLEAKPLSVTVEAIKLDLDGTFKNADEPDLDFTLSLPKLAAKQLKALADVPKDFVLPALKGTLKAHLDKKGLLNLKTLKLKGKGASLSLKARQTATGWTLRPSSLGWGPIKITAKGKVATPTKKRKETRLDLAVASNRIALAKLPPAVLERAPGLKGNAKLGLKIKGRTSKPVISGKADFDAVAYTVSGQKFTALKGDVTFNTKNIKGKLKGKWNGQDADLTIDARGYSGPAPDYRVVGRLALLDLNTLPSGTEKKKGAKAAANKKSASGKKKPAEKAAAIKTSGNIVVGTIRHPKFKAGKTTLKWNLKGVTGDLKGLDGTFAFNVGAGQFDDLKALVADKPLVKLLLLPVAILQKVSGLVKVPLFPRFDSVKFKEIMGDYVIAEGKLSVKKSHLDSNAAYAVMSGEADLGKDRLNLRVSTRLAKGLGGDVAGPIGFKVRGSLAAPQVILDPTSLLKQPVVNDVLKKGEKLLKSLFR